MRQVRIGYISTVDKETGMASVVYPDRGSQVTSMMPCLRFGRMYALPEVGEQVAVLYRGEGASDGVIAGAYWSEDDRPPVNGGFYLDAGDGTHIKQSGGKLELADTGGAITVTAILERLESLQRQIDSLR